MDQAKNPADESAQMTRPKGIDPKTGKPHEPVEIPIPKEDDFEKLVRRAMPHRPPAEPDDASDAGSGADN